MTGRAVRQSGATIVAGIILSMGCARDQTTPDGIVIPGKSWYQLRNYEHVCELTMEKGPGDMEQTLDRFGRQGWRLAGFMHKDGDTVAFCMVR